MNATNALLTTSLRGVGFGPLELATTRPLDWTNWAGSDERPLAGRMVCRGGVAG